MGPSHHLPGDCLHSHHRLQDRYRRTIHKHLSCAVARAIHHQHKLPASRRQHVDSPLFRMIIQLVSLIIYCSAPIMIFSVVSFILRLFLKSFILDLVLAAGAVALTIRGTRGYFSSLVDNDKKRLMLYPVLLFYVFLATYIAMA